MCKYLRFKSYETSPLYIEVSNSILILQTCINDILYDHKPSLILTFINYKYGGKMNTLIDTNDNTRYLNC